MKQVRNTKAKAEILNLLTKSGVALSGTEIQSSVEKICDRATTYRVLERLINEGMIHKIVDVDRVVKYAKCTNCTENHIHNHLHFSCQKCHTVTCLENVHPSFQLPAGYKIIDVNFTVTGICPKCNT